MKKILKGIKNPRLILLYLMNFKIFRLLTDEQFIKLKYYLTIGEKLDLDNPVSFNEKLQWLKLHDKNPLYTQLADKYKVRSFVKEKIGEEYLIPQYGVYDSFDEINFDELPEQFVLKPTHTSGNVFVCLDKNKINYSELEKEINMWLKREYFWVHREWPYKNIEPKIIAEKYISDPSQNGLNDYKFYSFHGEPKILLIASNRDIDVRFDYFDLEFNHLPISLRNSQGNVEKPVNFTKMIELSRILASDIPHVRVDFYEVNGKIYFGELTFFSDSGYGYLGEHHEEYDNLFGSWINLN